MGPLALYRLGHWAHRVGIPLLPRGLDLINRFVFSTWIPHTATLGSGVILGYGGLAIVIHAAARIGNGVHIDQGVTIGGDAVRHGVPSIGNNVYIGAGAKILGPISVGDGSVIGANAVVNRDIPARSVAVGVPARVVRSDIDIHQYLYHLRTETPVLGGADDRSDPRG